MQIVPEPVFPNYFLLILTLSLFFLTTLWRLKFATLFNLLPLTASAYDRRVRRVYLIKPPNVKLWAWFIEKRKRNGEDDSRKKAQYPIYFNKTELSKTPSHAKLNFSDIFWVVFNVITYFKRNLSYIRVVVSRDVTL